jgi:hypothetical protein
VASASVWCASADLTGSRDDSQADVVQADRITCVIEKERGWAHARW